MNVGERLIRSTAVWLALSYACAFAVFFLWGAFSESEADVVLMFLVAIPWTVAPVLAAGAFVRASPTLATAVAFLVLELGLILSMVGLFVEVWFLNPAATSGIAILAWPLVQWAAMGIWFLAALMLGWRMRPDFLKG